MRWFTIIFAAVAISLLAVIGLAMAEIGQAIAPLFIGTFAVLTLIAAFVMYARRIRVSFGSRETVLPYLEQAIVLNQPLPKAFAAMAYAASPARRAAIEAAQRDVESGASLGSALTRARLVPASIGEIITVGESSGRLPQIVTWLEARRVQELAPSRIADAQNRGFYRTYPYVVLLMIMCVVSLHVVFVAPKLEQIFRDFQIQLPWLTRALLQVCRAVNGWAFALAAILVALIFRGISRSGRRERIRRSRGPRAYGEALLIVAEALREGRDLIPSLREASRIIGDKHVARSLESWAESLERGVPTGEAAREAGAPRLVWGLLGADHLSGEQKTTTIAFLGNYYIHRFNRTAVLLEAAIVPAMTLALGALVTWIALSMFLPIVRLIDATQPYLYYGTS